MENMYLAPRLFLTKFIVTDSFLPPPTAVNQIGSRGFGSVNNFAAVTGILAVNLPSGGLAWTGARRGYSIPADRYRRRGA